MSQCYSFNAGPTPSPYQRGCRTKPEGTAPAPELLAGACLAPLPAAPVPSQEWGRSLHQAQKVGAEHGVVSAGQVLGSAEAMGMAPQVYNTYHGKNY